MPLLTNAAHRYTFSPGVSYHIDNDTLEIRKGVWNSFGFKVTYRPTEERMIRYIVDKMSSYGVSPSETKARFRLKGAALRDVTEMIDNLHDRGLIRSGSETRSGISVIRSLFAMPELVDSSGGKAPRILIVTDNDTIKRLLKSWSNSWKRISLAFESCTKFRGLELTKTEDGFRVLETCEKMARIKAYQMILYLSSTPNRAVLLNLNRLSIKFNKVLTVAMIDGFYLLIASFSPRETGCFECIETNRPSNSSAPSGFAGDARRTLHEYSPLSILLSSMAFLELFLLSTMGRGYFMGKLLHIHLTSFRVQVHEILRMPDCPACGYAALTRPRTLYFDSESIINELQEEIAKRKKMRGKSTKEVVSAHVN